MIIESIPTPDTPTLLAALSRWALDHGEVMDPVAGTARGVVCLDSALRADGLGRWTIAAACPVGVVTVDVDPFMAVGTLLGRRRDPGPTDLPFCGGVIGLWGYACRAAVEPGPWDAPHHGEPHAWWGFYDTFVAVDHLTQSAWIASWGLTTPHAEPSVPLAHERLTTLRQAIADAVARADPAEPHSTKDPNPRADPSAVRVSPAILRSQHADTVDAILVDIGAGEFYQACATYPMTGARGGATARDLFLALRTATPAPFAAFLAPGVGVAMAGASPERFLDLRQGAVSARPMKGTRPRGDDPDDDLRLRADLHRSAKDRAENVMIVDLMRNDLGRVCALGSVSVPALFTVETYASVHQMTSTITGTLRPEVCPWELARACFPPGSMTGAPKLRAMERLAELEVGPRGWYSGVVGYIDVRGEMDLAVVIRTGLVSHDEVRWHVGGGIVADSTADAEWRESLDKCPPLLR